MSAPPTLPPALQPSPAGSSRQPRGTHHRTHTAPRLPPPRLAAHLTATPPPPCPPNLLPTPDLDEELESRAAYIEGGAGGEAFALGFQCLAEDVAEVVPLFSEVVRSPAVPQSKLDLAKAQIANALGGSTAGAQPGVPCAALRCGVVWCEVACVAIGRALVLSCPCLLGQAAQPSNPARSPPARPLVTRRAQERQPQRHPQPRAGQDDLWKGQRVRPQPDAGAGAPHCAGPGGSARGGLRARAPAAHKPRILVPRGCPPAPRVASWDCRVMRLGPLTIGPCVLLGVQVISLTTDDVKSLLAEWERPDTAVLGVLGERRPGGPRGGRAEGPRRVQTCAGGPRRVQTCAGGPRRVPATQTPAPHSTAPALNPTWAAGPGASSTQTPPPPRRIVAPRPRRL
jgi:hypothetical protein